MLRRGEAGADGAFDEGMRLTLKSLASSEKRDTDDPYNWKNALLSGGRHLVAAKMNWKVGPERIEHV